MPNLARSSIGRKRLDSQAQARISRLTQDFTEVLLTRSKVRAHENGDDLVLPRHVDEARREMAQAGCSRSKSRDLAITVGSAVFGFAIQGFATEVSASTILPLWVTIYAVLG